MAAGGFVGAAGGMAGAVRSALSNGHAMAQFQAQLRPTGAWVALNRALSRGRYDQAMARYASAATFQNAKDFQELARRFIKERRYAPNAPLTIAVKGRDFPLVEYGDLFEQFKVKYVGNYTYFVGIGNDAPRTHSPNGKKGTPLVDVANILHEGFILVLTPAMIAAIMMKLGANDPGALLQYNRTRRAAGAGGGGGGPKVRYVPPRPFVKSPFEDDAFQRRCETRWERAMEQVLAAASVGGSNLSHTVNFGRF